MMREAIHRHIGVRAEGMILAAAIWGLIGVGAVVDQPSLPLIVAAWHLLIPAPVTAAMWIVTGALAAALAPSERWSPTGLALLTVAPTLRCTSYLWAWMVELVPGPPPGDPRGWYSAVFYALMIAYIILLSHIPATVRAPLTGRRR